MNHLTTIEDKRNRFQRVELILTHKLAKIKSVQEICSTGKHSVFKNYSNNEFRTETSYAELEESKKRTMTRTNPLGLAFLKLDAGLRFCWNVAMPLIPSTSTWLLGIDEEGDGTRILSTIMEAPNWSRRLRAAEVKLLLGEAPVTGVDSHRIAPIRALTKPCLHSHWQGLCAEYVLQDAAWRRRQTVSETVCLPDTVRLSWESEQFNSNRDDWGQAQKGECAR